MKRHKATLIHPLLLSILALPVLAGCVVGVKERVIPLWISHEPIPESVDGIPVIHTNKPIPCTIRGKGIYFKTDCGGMVPVPMALYDRMLKAYNAPKSR